MFGKWAQRLTLVFLLLLPPSGTLFARQLGMVADNGTKSVTIFDPTDNNAIVGTVYLPQSPTPSLATGDCVITSDLKWGFVSDFEFRVWAIDLTADPPRLAEGNNPIPIGNRAEDLVLTTDGRYLVACDGSNDQPVVLVDIASRQQVASIDLGTSCAAVDICPDGSILANCLGASDVNGIRRLVIEQTEDGPALVDTGVRLDIPSGNVYCSPTGTFGAIVRQGAREVVTFSLPDLQLIDRLPLSASGAGVSGEFNHDGSLFYARSVNANQNASGFVDLFHVDTATGLLSYDPDASFAIGRLSPTTDKNWFVFFGMEQIALNPEENLLYVPEGNVVSIYDPATGFRVTQFRWPNAIAEASGITIVEESRPLLVDVEPNDDRNRLNLRGNSAVKIAVLSSPDVDAVSIDPASVLLGDYTLWGVSGATPEKSTVRDVNRDGLDDLLLTFQTSDLVNSGGVSETTLLLRLTGRSADGYRVLGIDYIQIQTGGRNKAVANSQTQRRRR